MCKSVNNITHKKKLPVKNCSPLREPVLQISCDFLFSFRFGSSCMVSCFFFFLLFWNSLTDFGPYGKFEYYVFWREKNCFHRIMLSFVFSSKQFSFSNEAILIFRQKGTHIGKKLQQFHFSESPVRFHECVCVCLYVSVYVCMRALSIISLGRVLHFLVRAWVCVFFFLPKTSRENIRKTDL